MVAVIEWDANVEHSKGRRRSVILLLGGQRELPVSRVGTCHPDDIANAVVDADEPVTTGLCASSGRWINQVVQPRSSHSFMPRIHHYQYTSKSKAAGLASSSILSTFPSSKTV